MRILESCILLLLSATMFGFFVRRLRLMRLFFTIPVALAFTTALHLLAERFRW